MDPVVMDIVQIAVPAAAALLGVAIGGWNSSASTRSSNAFQWNTGLMKESRDFYVEVTEASNGIYIALGAVVNNILAVQKNAIRTAQENGAKVGDKLNFHYKVPEHLSERLSEAQAKFRASLAKKAVHAGEDLSSAMDILDSRVDRMISIINGGDLMSRDLKSELDKLGLALKPVYLTIQILKINQNLVILNTVHPKRGRRKARVSLMTDITDYKLKLTASIEAAKVAPDASQPAA